MRNGLFKHYIATFAFTLIICTFLMGLAQLYFSVKNFTDERQQMLSSTAERAEAMVQERVPAIADLVLDKDLVLEDLRAIYQNTGVTVFITDINGQTLVCSEGDDCVHTTQISENILATAIRRGSYSHNGYFDGFFRHQGSYLYGRPLFEGGTITGFLFASLPITPLFSHLADNIVTFVLSAIFMLVVAIVIIYFATRRLIRPLHEISNAAISFGSGDFDARVPVTGDDEIARLARSFNNMADSLTEFETMRRSFVANVSHELRTPMTTIGGYIDGILDQTIPPDKSEHYLSIVSSEVKRLSRLTASLLDITRMEEGAYQLKVQSLNVWEVLLAVMSSAENRILEKKLHIPDLDAQPRYALCDRDMLYQIIYNLFDNAIKFTPEEGTLEVKVTSHGGLVHIAIRNSGDGVSERELNRIFERFYKIDQSRGLDRTGTGLGLYIAKTLAQRMDGDLFAESAKGKYAEFVVSLKAGAAPEKSRRESKKKPAGQETTSWLKRMGINFRS